MPLTLGCSRSAQLVKLRVIVLLQITAICAILVHDTFARYGVMDLSARDDTLTVVLITVVGGTFPQVGPTPSTCGTRTSTPTCDAR